ncbi:MAG TPA: antitoxin [Allosphingosinicella sp.]|nr:antitoxin [Allosphingosinicella sp.]
MAKPSHIDGYDPVVTDAAERVLVTLLRGLGPWKKTVFLVGGLTPRYLVPARPPAVPRHAGTGDVDIVLALEILGDTDAYRTLEENLDAMGFHRALNKNGNPQSWRWVAQVEGGPTMILEFLTEHAELGGGEVKVLPTEGKVSALNIPHSSIVFDHHKAIDVTAELLDGKGKVTETVRYADIVALTCLKAFAFNDRGESKDSHDLIYCLEHGEGGIDAAVGAFYGALGGPHRDAIMLALDALKARFCTDEKIEGFEKDGPVKFALFEDDGDDEGARDRRILRQRRAATIVESLVMPLRSA